jgi:hypothetical protein
MAGAGKGALSIAEKFVTGVVGIGLVTAFALHAASLTTLVDTGGTAAQNLLGTAEKG